MKPKNKIGISMILIIIVAMYAIAMTVISLIPEKSTLAAVNDTAVVAEDSQIVVQVLGNDLDTESRHRNDRRLYARHER
ncbi:MAG: hypothetical protein MZU97_16320 [Bacillus subtilis]|nr:hypothetical protein [Bacillus subtilis]